MILDYIGVILWIIIAIFISNIFYPHNKKTKPKIKKQVKKPKPKIKKLKKPKPIKQKRHLY